MSDPLDPSDRVAKTPPPRPEPRRAEESLRATEELLHSIVDQTEDLIFVKDCESRMIFLNPSAIRGTGLSAVAMLGRRDDEYQHDPAQMAAFLAADRRVMESRQPETVEETLTDAHGVTRVLLTTKSPRFDSEGNVIGIIGVSRDITQRKEAEDAVRRSETLLRSITENTEDLIFLKDREGRMLFINPAFERLLGVPAHEVLGRTYAERDPGSRLATVFAASDQRVIETGQTQTFEEVRDLPSGRRVLLTKKTPRLDAQGRIIGIVGVARDITESKRAEQALRESEERFRTLADNIAQLAWMADEAGAIFWYNRRWLEYTGRTLESLKDSGWRELHHPDHNERVAAKFHQSVERGEAWEDTFPLRGQDGQYRWFLSRAMPIRDPQARVIRWFGTHTDVTEQRELTEQVVSAKELAEQASRAKDNFLAALSHELRTPLSPVLLAASELCDDPRLPPDLRGHLTMIHRNVALEARLIDDLLDLTRIARGQMRLRREWCSAHVLLGHAIEIVHRDIIRKGLSLLEELGAEHAWVEADPARLQQVFWNLLVNAVKFTPRGGRIHLRTRNDGAALIVEVSDTGRGIEPEMIERVFDPFEQGSLANDHRFGGLGLGLAIGRSVVEQHGGKLTAGSGGLGCGATFRVELPTTAAIAHSAPVPAEDSSAHAQASASPLQPIDQGTPPAGMRLLLVEDHEATLRTLERLLRRAGYRITAADSIGIALAHAAGETFDALISDIGLPDGSGYELLAKLRLLHPSLPAIAVSGYGMDEDVQRSREAGFFAHLTKPIELPQLKKVLHEIAAAKA